MQYKVTGVLTTGRRFKAIHTTNRAYALGINLYRGSVWERPSDDAPWRRIREVYN